MSQQPSKNAVVAVETTVQATQAHPGETLCGTVLLHGGQLGQDILVLTLDLVAYWTTGSGNARHHCVIHRTELLRDHRLESGQTLDVEFELPLPFEIPLTIVADRPLPGTEFEIVTSIDIDETRHTVDSTPISVLPLPAQAEIHSAIATLGFKPRTALLEDGWLRGLERDLPLYQSIDFEAAATGLGIDRLRVTLLTGEDGVEMIMESDPPRSETYGSLYLDHSETGDEDLIDAMREQLAKFTVPESSR